MNLAVCPACSKQLRYSPQQAGKQVQCPACQTAMILPGVPTQGYPANQPLSSQPHPVAPSKQQTGGQQMNPLSGQAFDPLMPANQQPYHQTPGAYGQTYPTGPPSQKPISRKKGVSPIILFGSIGGGLILTIIIICVVAFRPGNRDEVATTSEENSAVGNPAIKSDSTIMCEDDFEDGTIDPLWTSTATKGLTVTESNGAVKIGGIVPRHPERYVSAIMNLSEQFETRSFTAEIDVLATSGTFEKAKHRSRGFSFFAVGENKRNVGVQFWANQYKIAYNLGSGQKRKYSPSNGDEMTTWYRWRIEYDAPNQNASVYIDGRQIGETVAIDLGEKVTFNIRVTCIPNTQIEGSFDNFEVRTYPPGQSPPSALSKVSTPTVDNAPKIVGGSIPIPNYLVESKSRITDVESGALFPAVFRESLKATMYAFECKGKSVKDIVDWFNQHASQSGWEVAATLESEISPGGVQLNLHHKKIDQILYVEIGPMHSKNLRVLFSLMKKN